VLEPIAAVIDAVVLALTPEVVTVKLAVWLPGDTTIEGGTVAFVELDVMARVRLEAGG